MNTGASLERLPARRSLGEGGFPSKTICPSTGLSQPTVAEAMVGKQFQQQQFQQL